MHDSILVLTYHSISDAGGPTSIPTPVFAMQMETLAQCGYSSVTLGEFMEWHDGKADPGRRVLITFDDAYMDFAQIAAPILRRHGFGATVFVPTGLVGQDEEWVGSNRPPRPLMGKAHIKALARKGIEFGAHGRAHLNLAQLAPQAREAEIAGSGTDLADMLGKPTLSFAAPFGAVNPETVATIGQHYQIAFGTRFDIVRQGEDRFDIPRIDMHYFRKYNHWRSFVAGNLVYLRARQALRWVGNKVRPRG